MKPRELSKDECSILLSSARYGRLGLAGGNLPYVVPMSYVYHGNVIYLHSRGKGKKVECVTENPNVCFQIDVIQKDRWSSVAAFGIATLSDSVVAKQKMFDAFTEKGQGGHGGKKFSREELEKMDMTIWEINIKEITGREGVW
jgi:nitroimidazol reductase NimA-like FMN-containing flavoprotein (pyridoxamine 5'-phosphate oxidase superfamily)